MTDEKKKASERAAEWARRNPERRRENQRRYRDRIGSERPCCPYCFRSAPRDIPAPEDLDTLLDANADRVRKWHEDRYGQGKGAPFVPNRGAMPLGENG